MKIIKHFSLISLLLLFTVSIFAAEKPRVAVMPFKAGSGISKPEAAYLTELVRTELISIGIFDVISNDQLETMLKTKQKKQGIGSGSCTSAKCIVDLGNALECEKMIVGSAAGAFGEFAINVKMLDVVKQKYEFAKRISIKNKNMFPSAAKRIVLFLSGSKQDLLAIQQRNDERLRREKYEKERHERAQREKEIAKTRKLEWERNKKERALQEKAERKRIVSLNQSQGVTYSGMLLRSLLLPGLGHTYANQPRGWFYMLLWGGVGGAFAYTHLDYSSKQDDYLSTETDFDSKYDAANNARALRRNISFAFAGIYLLSIFDILFSGNSYIQMMDNGLSKDTSFRLHYGSSNKPNKFWNQQEDQWNIIIERKF